MRSAAASGCVAPPEALARGEYAFFLDLDGLLADCTAQPEDLGAYYELHDLLGAAVLCSDGALTLISARPIADVDDVLNPLELPVVGSGGLEWRNAQGSYSRPALGCMREIQRAQRLMTRLAALDRRLTLELTSFAVALDYRKVPDLEATVVRTAQAIAELTGARLEVRHRRGVVEVRPAGVSKASAIATFMREGSFRGRQPLYLGDELSDEAAFEYVNAAGGLSVAVNVKRPTAASARLASIGDARGWLHTLVAHSFRWRTLPCDGSRATAHASDAAHERIMTGPAAAAARPRSDAQHPSPARPDQRVSATATAVRPGLVGHGLRFRLHRARYQDWLEFP